MVILISEKFFVMGSTTEERFLNYVSKELKTDLNFLDEGSDGIVYWVDRNTVIKFSITYPQNEAKLVGKHIPGIVDYYGVGKIQIPREVLKDNEFQFLNRLSVASKDLNAYWCKMERLSPAPYVVLEKIDAIFGEFEAQHSSSYHRSLFGFAMDAPDATKKEFLDYIGDYPQIVTKYTSNLYTIAGSLKHLGIRYNDFRFDNLGVDSQGNLKLFDITLT